MRKLVSFMHTSLDGFVAGPNGEMDWINIEDEMFEFAGKRTDESDTALYGRVTYQLMESYWPTAAELPNATKHDIQHSTWYKKVAKVVLSNSMKGVDLKNTTIVGENLAVEIEKLKQATGMDIIIFGSPGACHSLMGENLIDELWLFVNPIILGQGIPLFKDIRHAINLDLQSTRVFASGVICSNYKLIREG